MGREVRPVALGWEHPREPGRGRDGTPWFIPLHSRESLQWRMKWRAEHPDDPDEQEPVDLGEYMPEIPEGAAVGWAFYETVSEGTPCSPVFASKDELAAWLASPEAGRDRMAAGAAARFVAAGWAPSFVMTPETGFVRGTEWVGGQHG